MPPARLRACGVRRAWPCPAALSGFLPCVSGGSGGGAPAACPCGAGLAGCVSGPSCLRPASGGLSHGFSRIPAPCGFRRALSCPPSFVRMRFLSFAVCRRMPWMLAAFSGDFLFHDSCPAPFACVGCPLFPAVFGHAWCGFSRGLPVHALSVRGLSPSAGRLRLALKAFPFRPACIGGRRGCRRRRSFRGVSLSFPEAWPALKVPPRSISLPSCFCLPFQARRRKYR